MRLQSQLIFFANVACGGWSTDGRIIRRVYILERWHQDRVVKQLLFIVPCALRNRSPRRSCLNFYFELLRRFWPWHCLLSQLGPLDFNVFRSFESSDFLRLDQIDGHETALFGSARHLLIFHQFWLLHTAFTLLCLCCKHLVFFRFSSYSLFLFPLDFSKILLKVLN